MSLSIVGISGKKHSGKDFVATVFAHFLKPQDTIRIAFADGVKKEVAMALGIRVEEIEANKTAYRGILQWWGTDYRRKMFSEDYWIKYWHRALGTVNTYRHGAVILTPDVRFPNELEAVKKAGGIVLRVMPTNHISHAYDAHQSETALDSNEQFDYCIINNFQNARTTIEQVKQIIEKENR